MTKMVRTAKGRMVDFDLLKIKQQMSVAPKSEELKNRESMIDKKLRRKVKKEENEAPAAEKKPVKKIKKEAK